MGLEYDDFLDREYVPTDDDLVCRFRIEAAADVSREAAASRVASESSNGTWAFLDVPGDLTDLGATAFHIADVEDVPLAAPGENAAVVDVAYPAGLFEAGSLPQILSCIAGNIMGMKAVERIRLLDCDWPAAVVDAFPGPQYGPDVASELLDAGDRPVLATVPKPKVGLSTEAHVEIGRRGWRGGLDLLKDDENLTDQPFNPFEDRVTAALAARDDLEDETGDRKGYLINVTATGEEILDRVDAVAEQGGRFVMVDVVTAGWATVQAVRERCERHGLAIHAHRAMHAAFDRVPEHGVSMRCIAQFARLAGVDHIHTGTAGLGKLENEDTAGINDWLGGDFHGLRSVVPVASGGLHPGVVDELVDVLGPDIMIQAGGGVHGHPDGTEAGARALRAATEAAVAGEALSTRAEDVPALATALEHWGNETPR